MTDEELTYQAPDGTEYKIGETIERIRINGVLVCNDIVVLGTCDWCDWKVVGPTCLIGELAQAHLGTHVLNEIEEIGDSFRHPDFKE